KAQLNRARRMELPPKDDPGYDAAVTKQRQEQDKAQPLFLVASKNFDAAAKQLKAQLDGAPDPLVRQVLEAEAADAELAAAVNQYLLAETLRSTDAARTVQRDKYLEEARIRFARLGAEFANSRVGWIAQAWRAEVLREQSKGAEADTIFKDILASNLPEAEDGKRMVRFFQVRRDYQAAVDVRDSGRLQAVEKDL